MLDYALLETAVRSPAVLSMAAALVIVYLLGLALNRPKSLSLPVASDAADGNFEKSLTKAKMMYPDTPFILPSNPPRVIIPVSLTDEVKNLPDNVLSFRQATYKLMLGRYTSIGETNHEQLINAIKIDLTRNIAKTLSDLQDEVVHAVDINIGECPDWQGIKVYTALLDIVARISGRVFVGLPLCRDQDWITATITYTQDLVAGLQAIEKYPSYFRPLVAPFVTELRKLRGYRMKAGKMLGPTIAAIMKAAIHGEKQSSSAKSDNGAFSTGEDQYNLASWILSHHKSREKVKAEAIGEDQMLASFAAIHTTSLTASHVIFDLASYPEYAEELRAEIRGISAEEPDGKLRKISMPKLRKLDSFVKESQRMHPLGLTNMNRIVTARNGLTLSTGHHLPKDTFIAITHPHHLASVSTDTCLVAAALQPPLSEFHPFRYSDLRAQPGEENHHQFVTTGPDSNLSFGHGQWACPGRFFASNEIKVIVVELLRKYDIALGPNGEGQGGEFKRPLTHVSGTSYFPDPTANIYFKSRQAA